ncbi:hypothetical protein [Vibrio nigripulchritudo]|uniref:hypothetical protein n=1 Tax=Vibrio nigripulchritudo TaxID=28173 RepID=UPI0012D45DA1|nr:hypothetical protein [Vibrio nigripulchritudo]
MEMKKIWLIFVIVLTVTFGSQAITYALSDVVEIKLRQHTFLIPKHVAMDRESVMPDWLLNMSGLDDDSSSTLFRFDDQEVKASVPTYQVASNNQFADDIEVLMTALTPEEFNAYIDPNDHTMIRDLWQAKGSYTSRKVEPAEIPGWYKVYRTVEYPNSWALLNQYPDSEKQVPETTQDFWVAHCLMLGPKDKRVGSCRTHVLIGDIVVEFSISDYNLHLLDEIKAFVKSQVQEWKQS